MYLYKVFIVKFLIILYLNQTSGYNILWLSGVLSPSHQMWSGILQKALIKHGHNITVLSVDENDSQIVNLTHIHLENVYNHYSSSSKNLSNMLNIDPFNAITTLASYRTDMCIPALKSNGFKTLMNYPKDFKFDLVIHDFVGAHCLLGFVPRFGNPPLISASATICPVAISTVSGNPQYPEFIPANHLDDGFKMNLLSRIYNSLLYIYDNIVRMTFMIPEQNEATREYFRNKDIDVFDISHSSILTLVNLAPYDVMQPFFQTVIPVGGLQIQSPKPLNEKFNNFISKFENGIIYFALGTNIKSEDFHLSKIKYLLEAFNHFPTYGFLWKYDPEMMKHKLPKNVMIEKWMPQNDILANPKTKLFIGHGGALSCQEAVWYGVPQIIIPFIIDQKHNAARAVERGIALRLDHDDMYTENIIKALQELLNNPSFSENTKKLSKIFRDQPLSPLKRAIFWIEYVLRNGKNAELLKSPGQTMSKLYQIIPELFIAFIVILFALIMMHFFAMTIVEN